MNPQDANPAAGGLSEQLLTTIRDNTIAVMTKNTGQREEWQEMLQRLLDNAREEGQGEDAAFLQAVYDLTEGKTPDLPGNSLYRDIFLDILTGIASGGDQPSQPVTKNRPAVEEPQAAEADVSSEVMNTIRNNTVAVMTVAPEKRAEWRKTIADIQAQAEANQLVEDNAFFQALLDLMDGKEPLLPSGSPYQAFLDRILDGVNAYESQPEGAMEPVAPGSGLTANLIRTIHDNTVAVMTRVPDKREDWRAAVTRVLSQAEAGQMAADVAFFQAVLDILDEEEPDLPADNPHSAVLRSIQEEIAGEQAPEVDEETKAMLSAMRAFLTTNNWDETGQVLEQHQEILLRPQVEDIFEDNIRHAREQGHQQAADMMQIHLALLRDAKELGIPAAIERVKELARQAEDEAGAQSAPQETGADLEPGPGAPGLPEGFARDVVAAIRGSSARKQQLFEMLSRLHPQEKGAEDLIRETQKALFGDAVERLGKDLPEPYASVWQAIARGVKGTD